MNDVEKRRLIAAFDKKIGLCGDLECDEHLPDYLHNRQALDRVFAMLPPDVRTKLHQTRHYRGLMQKFEDVVEHLLSVGFSEEGEPNVG